MLRKFGDRVIFCTTKDYLVELFYKSLGNIRKLSHIRIFISFYFCVFHKNINNFC